MMIKSIKPCYFFGLLPILRNANKFEMRFIVLAAKTFQINKYL